MSDENDPLAAIFRVPSAKQPAAPEKDQRDVLLALMEQLADIEKRFGNEEALEKASFEEKQALLTQLKDVQDAISAMNKIH